jgi:serine/threonine protein kinase
VKPTDQEQQLDEIIADYLEALETGTAPARQELLDRYPDVAVELTAFFADQDQFDNLVLPLRQALPGSRDSTVAPAEGTLPLDRDSPTLPGSPSGVFGDYELLEVIARGGMGVVYKARQIRLNRLVALKMIRAGELAGREEVERFRLEATAAATLEHPNIVPIYEIGEEGNRQFFTMKLVNGGSLAQRLQSGAWHTATKAQQRLAARLMAQVARAIHYAHERGILHRDLKPSNILLQLEEPSDPSPEESALSRLQSALPLVSDFGLAKRLATPDGQADITPTGMVIGTPGYIAPEQAAGRAGELTTAADIYSMGAILYTLLTGCPPFQGDTPMDTLLQALERDPVPPRAVAATVDTDLQTICLKCLQKQPSQRYATAASLADDLECYLQGIPVRARPVTGWERLWRWCRRKPLVAGLAAALLLALLSGFGLVTWQWRRTQQHARRAEESLAEAEDNLRLAHQAVNHFYARVSADKLHDVPGMQGVRKELLEAALVYYEKFIEKRGDDPTLQSEKAETYYRIATITSEIGANSAALEAYEQARRLYQKLLESRSDDTRLEASLAETHRRMGILQSGAGHWNEALASYQQARDQLTRLHQAHPDDAGVRYGLAAIDNNLGNLYRMKGQTKQALASFEKARDIYEDLVRADPRNRQFRGALSATYSNLAMTSAALGRRTNAIQLYRQAGALLEKLVEDGPSNLASRKDLARIDRLLGGELLLEGQHDEALRLLQQGHALLERLARENPGIKDFQLDLAASHRQIGHVQRDRGQRAEALAHYQQGRDIMEKVVRSDPGVPGYRNDLAKCCFDMAGVLSKTGRRGEALPLYQRACEIRKELVAANPDNLEFRADLGSSLNNLAVMYWNLGQHNEALTILRKSIEQKRIVCARAPDVSRYRGDLSDGLSRLARWEQEATRGATK